MNRCPHCAAAVTTTPHDRPILLDADGGPHAATCAERVRVARVVPCVTPTGRTDCHGQYIERDDEGRMVCTFCKLPLAGYPKLDGAAIAKALVTAVTGKKGRGR